ELWRLLAGEHAPRDGAGAERVDAPARQLNGPPRVRREILIDGATPQTPIAPLEDEGPAQLYVERPDGRGLAGDRYKGRVSNVLPGMQAAFVDIGTGRDAFLHARDLEAPAADEEARDPASPEVPEGSGEPGRPALRRIEDLVREGQDILVQVSKDP